MNNREAPALMRAMAGECVSPPPVWLMRQAGRYLPEYRQLRSRAESFLDFCYAPELASEATLQPIRRFDLDAAILFSDILVIPDALGRRVSFEEGKGPVLDPLSSSDIPRMSATGVVERLSPVLETIARVRKELPGEVALLGFCGAPWTVATYMIAGSNAPDRMPARLFAHRRREDFSELIALLRDVSADYLIAQLRAGADAVQIFDSWAGVLGEEDFSLWSAEPVREMIRKVRSSVPDARIIGFPRGAGERYDFWRRRCAVDCLALDWTVPLSEARKLQDAGPVQGNLDPARLLCGGEALDAGVDAILEALSGNPLIFNLGHGVAPQTPVANVERMVKRIRRAART